MHLHENDQVEGLLVQTRARIHPFKNHSSPQSLRKLFQKMNYEMQNETLTNLLQEACNPSTGDPLIKLLTLLKIIRPNIKPDDAKF